MSRFPADCRYFANGICSKGSACSFAHDLATRSENICHFNLVGKCSFGQACRFIHSKPQNEEQRPCQSTSSSLKMEKSENPVKIVPKIRPVQLPKPGLNIEASEFVPSWKKKAPPVSYAAAAAASCSSSSGECSSSQIKTSDFLCPYYERNGECTRIDTDCPFVHGDKCDLCSQWSLHPTNEEIRIKHQNECVASHSQEMERAFMLQKTENKTCGICMENITEKNLRFGILNGCQHCFCLDCIRQWRSRDQESADLATKTVRSCPECRQHSDYVIPSLFWVEAGQEKDLLIEMYKENTKSKTCKYYVDATTRGNCPFGNKCFYKHQLPDGSIDPGESPHARRRARLVDFLFRDEDTDEEDDDDFLDGIDDPELQRLLNQIADDDGRVIRSIGSLVNQWRAQEQRRIDRGD